MIKITLPDGNIKEMKKGSSAMDVALSISEGLARSFTSGSKWRSVGFNKTYSFRCQSKTTKFFRQRW